MKLHYAGQPGEGFGWGRCNHYLQRELGKLCELTAPESADVVFMPLADHDFNPATSARARVNVGYTFFEYSLGPNAVENAKKYDIVFCGSTWCLDRMRERGITNGKVLIQGVDQSVFSRCDPRQGDSEFRIFSGGKFEWRKGQDLVLAAFRLLMTDFPEMRLVVSWHSLWPQLYQTMAQSSFIRTPRQWTADWESNLRLLLDINWIPRKLVYVAPPCPQQHMAFLMEQTDCGVFPNRCEGGTNLVLMEYAALGRPVIANVETGHADVAGLVSYKIPTTIHPDTKWAHSRPEDVAEQITKAYTAPHPAGAKTPIPWTWEASAKTVIDSLAPLV